MYVKLYIPVSARNVHFLIQVYVRLFYCGEWYGQGKQSHPKLVTGRGGQTWFHIPELFCRRDLKSHLKNVVKVYRDAGLEIGKEYLGLDRQSGFQSQKSLNIYNRVERILEEQ